MFETARFNRISQNIVKQIRQAIIRGDLRPGDRLPSEKELSEKFGVSKTSLREAFRALEALGLLEVRQGVSGGAFVREVDLETAREGLFNYLFFKNPSIDEFTQLRRIIEPQVSSIAAREITDKELQELEENLERTRKQLESGNFSYEIDIEFHRIIASTARNSLIYLIVDAMQSALVNIKQLLKPDHEFTVEVYQSHLRILDAIRQKDAGRASQEMLKHVNAVGQGLKALSKIREGSLKEEGEIPYYKPLQEVLP